MAEKTNNIWEKIKSFFGTMSRGTKIAIVVVLAAILIIFFARWVVIQTRPYEPLFFDLTSSDMAAVVGYMGETGRSDYRKEGDTIYVPDGTANQLMAELYMNNIPTSGTGYERFSSMVGSMSTDSDKVIAERYDLQDRLAAIIRHFDGVKDAVVNIAAGEDSRYVLDSSNMTPTTVGVVLTLSGSQPISTQTAAAIRTAVAHMVTGLNVEYVAITDNLGNTYSGVNTGSDAVMEASNVKFQLEEDMNNKLRSEIMWLLSRIYGTDNLRITVNTEVDVDRKITSSTEYPMPEDWLGEDGGTDGRGIYGTEIWNNYIYGGDGTNYGSIVGATPNSDIPMYPVDTDGDGVADAWGGSSGQVDYQNNTVQTQKEYLAGTVTDVKVAVSINSDVTNTLSLEELVRQIGVAAGIPTEDQAEKVNVIFAPFTYDDGVTVTIVEGIEPWILYAILGGIALFLIVLVIIIILVRKKKREEEEEQARLEEEERLEQERAAAEIAALEVPPVDGADIMDLNTEKSMELRKDLRTFVGNNPEIAAALLRNLMKGGEQPDAS